MYKTINDHDFFKEKSHCSRLDYYTHVPIYFLLIDQFSMGVDIDKLQEIAALSEKNSIPKWDNSIFSEIERLFNSKAPSAKRLFCKSDTISIVV